MLIKRTDDKYSQLALLESILSHTELSTATLARVTKTAERFARYIRGHIITAAALDDLFQKSDNWAVIHDLRLQVDGEVAHIDHLVMNRLLEVWIIGGAECAEGLRVLSSGQCFAKEGAEYRPVASPFIELERACDVLRRVLLTRASGLPVRAGEPILPQIRGLVVLPVQAELDLQGERPEYKSVVRTNGIANVLEATMGPNPSLRALARLVSSGVMVQVARSIEDLHEDYEHWREHHFRKIGGLDPRSLRELQTALGRAGKSEVVERGASFRAD